MRRTVGAAVVAAAFVLTATAVVADPETATIDFENAPAGSISEAYSNDFRHGPFAIQGSTAEGGGQAIVDVDPSGWGQYLTLDNVTGCGCAMLRIDLRGASGEAAEVESLRIVGTKNPAHVVFLDAGGNAWPQEAGQWVDATGQHGSTTIQPDSPAGDKKIVELVVLFEGCGGVDDIVLTREHDHEPPPPPAPPEPPAPPPPPKCELCAISFTFDGACGDVQVTDNLGNLLIDLYNVPAGYEFTIGTPGSADSLPDGLHFLVSHGGLELEQFDLPLMPRPDLWAHWGSFTVSGEFECAHPDDAYGEEVKAGKKGKKAKKPKKPKAPKKPKKPKKKH